MLAAVSVRRLGYFAVRFDYPHDALVLQLTADGRGLPEARAVPAKMVDPLRVQGSVIEPLDSAVLVVIPLVPVQLHRSESFPKRDGVFMRHKWLRC